MANRIVLVEHNGGRIGEEAAAGTITPGDLLVLGSTDTVIVHATEGGFAERLFAIEDPLQGNTIDDNYTTGNKVMCVHAAPGDEVFAYIKAGETITIGERLVSAGDGTLKAEDNVSSGVTVKQIVAVALAAADLSASGAVDTRIKVRVC